MKFKTSLNSYIVEIQQAYNNTKDLGNVQIIINQDVDNAEFVNRIGVLSALPKNYDGEMAVGMRVVVHHNIARITNGYKGEKVNDFHITENYYRVPYDLLFLYEKDGKWHTNRDYCFVKPIENEKVEKIGSIYIPETAQEKHKALQGEMMITNSHLDVRQGERVIFKPNSEHKYDLFGTGVYKMKIERILMRERRSDEPIPENAKSATILKDWVLA